MRIPNRLLSFEVIIFVAASLIGVGGAWAHLNDKITSLEKESLDTKTEAQLHRKSIEDIMVDIGKLKTSNEYIREDTQEILRRLNRTQSRDSEHGSIKRRRKEES